MKPAALLSALVAVVVLAMPGAIAEQPANGNTHSPYAGMQDRRIASLSEQEIDDLANGRGMGLALPAELNGYPGPRHALDLTNELRLSDEQRKAIALLFEAMRTEAIEIGRIIIAEEIELNRLFAEGEINPDKLRAMTARIATAQGRLRATHLNAHLAMMDILSPEQVAHYTVARGYAHGGHKAH